MFSSSPDLSQGTIDHLSHERLAGLLSHAVAKSPVDIRHLKTLDAIVGDVGNKVDIVNVKLALCPTLGIYFAKQFYLILIKVFADFLHHPYIAEKLGAKVTVAHHGLLNHAQMSINELNDFFLRTYLLGCNLVELV